jgi:hypothetical protein
MSGLKSYSKDFCKKNRIKLSKSKIRKIKPKEVKNGF